MHELAVTEEIIKTVLEASGGRKVKTIEIVIGDLSSFIDESIRFYFGLLTKETSLEEADLLFKRIPVKLRCYNCQKEFKPDETLLCPYCNNLGGDIIQGREFYIESIEVEDEDRDNKEHFRCQ
ncbi:MAG: hydrogenase maturation nickel metallochaperone HypA [bacterium]|nr:hydrogenase maturation nickel metallochaperone HypA [bacterium]